MLPYRHIGEKERYKMSNKFAEIAKKETTLSEVMDGRERLTVDQIMQKFPDGVTLTGFDLISGKDGSYPVFSISEGNYCFFGGVVLNNIAMEWTKACDGDIAETSRQLMECGGVKIKMHNKKTRNGNNLTAVDIIG